MSVALWQEVMVRILQSFSAISSYSSGRGESWLLRTQKHFIYKIKKERRHAHLKKCIISLLTENLYLSFNSKGKQHSPLQASPGLVHSSHSTPVRSLYYGRSQRSSPFLWINLLIHTQEKRHYSKIFWK